ncbi:L,D-transpeptidase [Candidatus Thiosymbion oneisti]|uniref:L,D-transpeptidase n=1 Tax=Candidatus Thiosymbion oneisti TaxID=589554 RepID=UPI000B7D574A|nr:L,D-transpeptidase [Candidatus Thiosymbion oneisti]
MRIDVDLSDAKLIVRKGDTESDSEYENILLESDIVSGCKDSKTPTGKFKAGKFIKDKTNDKFGPVPWSKDPWGNPYGPYFLQILNLKGVYTAYGIHGTRGGNTFNFVAPPIPRWMFGWFVDDDTEKYSYCSHGCIRISNRNIKKLFTLVLKERQRKPTGVIYIYISK